MKHRVDKSRTLRFKEAAQVGVEDSHPLKSGYFTTIISCSMKTVAGRHNKQ